MRQKNEHADTQRRQFLNQPTLRVLCIGAALVCHPLLAQSKPEPPDVLFGPLFQAVQQQQIFPDQKTFADAVPKGVPKDIVKAWQHQKQQPGFELATFIQDHFILPNSADGYVPPEGQTLRSHIDTLWPQLTRTTQAAGIYDSLLPLPEPYVIPGGRFREVYYWDSYFTMLGLAESGHWDVVQEMVDNFAAELDRYGLIPNGNRSYYLSRSQPPFFSLMIDLLASHKGDHIYVKYLPQLVTEYNYWMDGIEGLKNGKANKRVVKLADGSVLNRYWDARNVPRTESWLDDVSTANKLASDIDSGNGEQAKKALYRNLRAGAASGWDFSSRWFSDPQQLVTIRTTDLLPVDLNSLVYHLQKVIAYAYELDHKDALAQQMITNANLHKEAINRYLWNSSAGWYGDYNWHDGKLHDQLTAATLFPLFLHVASQPQANQVARAVESKLLKPGGLTTTLIHTGQQWDAPNGWAPLQWVAVEGLSSYQIDGVAKEVGLRFLRNVQATYDKEHKLVEKYVVSGDKLGGGGGGEYPLQDGFGWTNGVTLMLLDKYCPKNTVCNSAHDIPEH